MKPRKVLVVGGGVSGWMTATYLHAALNRAGIRTCDIRLVEAGESTTAEGGEGTLPELNRYLAMLGVNQATFMSQVGCTFSHGTRFVGWLRGEGEDYYHPFSFERPGSIDRAGERWLRSNRSIPFADTVSVQPALCRMDLAPLMLGKWDFGPPLSYGFHVDNLRFRDFLKSLGSAGAISYSDDPAVRAETDGEGRIAAVVTASARRLEADLYIDCSDDSALLTGALGVPWVDRSGFLPCDRAMSLSVPYERSYPGHVHPYTTATALPSGWIQEIPLLDRRSLKYFFTSSLQTDDQAAASLADIAGRSVEFVDGRAGPQRTGHLEQAWIGNCIAIGPSAIAIEPLEPTNLYLVHHAAAMLAEHFPLGEEIEPLAFRYNRIVSNRFYEMLDFVNLHYCLTQRDDTDFWQEARRPQQVNARLRAKLDFWRKKRPSPADFEDQRFPGQADETWSAKRRPADLRAPVDTAGLWNHENYEAVLYGMDFLRQECDLWYGADRPDTKVPTHIASRVASAAQRLPPHVRWLQQVVGMPAYGSR